MSGAMSNERFFTFCSEPSKWIMASRNSLIGCALCENFDPKACFELEEERVRELVFCAHITNANERRAREQIEKESRARGKRTKSRSREVRFHPITYMYMGERRRLSITNQKSKEREFYKNAALSLSLSFISLRPEEEREEEGNARISPLTSSCPGLIF